MISLVIMWMSLIRREPGLVEMVFAPPRKRASLRPNIAGYLFGERAMSEGIKPDIPGSTKMVWAGG
ncbi:hypothetical protein KCP76_15945 [Salmonella enterica subsp. enterica serovar Weltevreden]|nr:hypothetical protein KCP76_15945 [Salmonella enterica subsp. enterica serovar Weltevreden]